VSQTKKTDKTGNFRSESSWPATKRDGLDKKKRKESRGERKRGGVRGKWVLLQCVGQGGWRSATETEGIQVA